MRWVLITALGWPVEPEVNRNLAIVSGPTACARRASDARAVAGVASSSAKPVGVTASSVPGGTAAAMRLREARAVRGEDQAGRRAGR